MIPTEERKVFDLNNLILFINSFLSYFLVFAIIVVLILIAVMIGVRLRKSKDARTAVTAEEAGNKIE